jgi:hypothetical protein
MDIKKTHAYFYTIKNSKAVGGLVLSLKSDNRIQKGISENGYITELIPVEGLSFTELTKYLIQLGYSHPPELEFIRDVCLPNLSYLFSELCLNVPLEVSIPDDIRIKLTCFSQLIKLKPGGKCICNLTEEETNTWFSTFYSNHWCLMCCNVFD